MSIRNSHLNSTSVNDEVSLKELILNIQKWSRYLWSQWLIILVLGLLGGSLGLLYAVNSLPIYTASTTFVLEEGGSNNDIGKYTGMASMLGINIGGGTAGLFSGDNILELYRSRSMIQKALLTQVDIDNKEQLLIDRFIDFNGLRNQWDGDPSLKNISFNDTSRYTVVQDSIIRNIVKSITDNYLTVTKPDKLLSIIRVQVESSDEKFSKVFADQLVSTVNNFYIELKTKRAIENLAILQHQKDSVQAIMNGAIYESAATLDATPNLNPTRQVLRSSVQRSQFSAEANKTILGELIKNLELSKMALRKETPLIQVIDHPILPLKKEKMGKLKGIVLGGLLFGFLTVLFLFLKKKYDEIMEE